mmetsp:Transcript_17855/g.41907  ORF Transcript_17855/g.41907 Transcript_17855/m.41907 type:complete len:209 (-) Transcript_17855:33-659(-)
MRDNRLEVATIYATSNYKLHSAAVQLPQRIQSPFSLLDGRASIHAACWSVVLRIEYAPVGVEANYEAASRKHLCLLLEQHGPAREHLVASVHRLLNAPVHRFHIDNALVRIRDTQLQQHMIARPSQHLSSLFAHLLMALVHWIEGARQKQHPSRQHWLCKARGSSADILGHQILQLAFYKLDEQLHQRRFFAHPLRVVRSILHFGVHG